MFCVDYFTKWSKKQNKKRTAVRRIFLSIDWLQFEAKTLGYGCSLASVALKNWFFCDHGGETNSRLVSTSSAVLCCPPHRGSDSAGWWVLLFTECVKSRCLFCFSRQGSSAWPAASCWTQSTPATSALQLTLMRTHMHTNMESFWLVLYWGWGGGYIITNKQQQQRRFIRFFFYSSDIL